MSTVKGLTRVQGLGLGHLGWRFSLGRLGFRALRIWGLGHLGIRVQGVLEVFLHK